MRKTTRVYGQKAAIEFAKKNCTFHADWYIEKAERGVTQYQRDDAKKYETLVIEGYSELVDLFEFSVSPADTFRNEQEHYVLEDPRIVLRIVETGEILYPWESHYNSKKFSLAFDERNYLLRTRDFKFEEAQPNFIGVGTTKKIDAWLGYLRRKRQAEIDYDANGRRRNKEFQDAVAARFPKAWMNVGKDGWMSECRFKSGGIEYHYTAHDSGKFYRDTKIDYDAIKSTKELLGIE